MKTLLITILSSALAFTISAQKECECLENTYTVNGDITYTDKTGDDDQHYTEYYGFVKEGLVQFTKVIMSEGKLYKIYIHTIPAKDINWSWNQMFSSHSKHEKKKDSDGNEYIHVNYGVADGSGGTGRWTEDECVAYNNFKVKQKQKYIVAAFENKEAFDAFNDKIKADQ